MNHFNQGLGKIDAVRGAAAAWTNVPNADHRPVFAGYSPFGWATDGRNTIIFANGNGCTGSCLALTALVTQNDQEIIESDITFNNAVNWQTNGTDIDTQAVLTHEFGHSLGIHHSSVPRATMEPFYSGPGGRTLAVDDHSALQCSQNRYGYLRVRVHGPTSIGPNETGTWICAASGGGPPYTHSWLKTSVHGITRLGFGMRAETSDSVSFNIVCDVIDRDGRIGTGHRFVTVSGHPDHPF
ncbi:MAG: matrixin family metalloprotease [Thermoanaerobaculia bacterium]|nr:matrixin family metalloprotease [Thermoanaerobaculia bacterium]